MENAKNTLWKTHQKNKKTIAEKFNENTLEGIFQLFVVNGNSRELFARKLK